MSIPVNYDDIIIKDSPIYDFTLFTPRLNTETYPLAVDKDMYTSNDWFRDLTNQKTHSYPDGYMSEMNIRIISDYFNRIKDSAKLVVEIGVMPNMGVLSSTKVLIQEKNKECAYLGIDIEDRNYVNNYGENIHMLQTDSRNTSIIVEKIKQLGGSIDFLFIDGLHTIEQVKHELALIPYVKKGGVIGFHDTMIHIGPNVWLKAFDPNKFTINSYYEYNDWGISMLVKNYE
jgi:cephalosporin hydroxylase